MNATYPESLMAHFLEHSTLFETKENTNKKLLGLIGVALCVFLIIFPTLIPIPVWITRTLAVFIGLYCSYLAFIASTYIVNLDTGGEVKHFRSKKFAHPGRGTTPLGEDDMPIIEMYNKNDWEGLAKLSSAKDSPMRIEVYHDQKGKVFFLLLCRYFSESDYRGVADVKTIKEPEYSKVYHIIKKLK